MSDIQESIYTEIHLNSLFRDRGTLSNPTFIINPALKSDYIKVKNCQIPLTFNQINSGNGKLVFYESDSASTPRTATIPPGNYNPASLVEALETAMNAAGTQVYNVVVDQPSQVMKITGADKTFKVKFSSSTTGTSHSVFGFDAESDSGNYQTITAKRMLNINQTECVYIVSNTMVPGFQSNVLCKVPLTSPQNTLNQFDGSSCSFDIIPSDSTITDISLSIVDCDSLLPLDFNGAGFSVTLSVWS